jgi:transposase
LFLAGNEQKVSVINPARIKYFALCQNQGNKTDKADARLIAQYGRMQSPPPWRIACVEVRVLQEMMRRLHALSDLIAQEKNRMQAPGQCKAVIASSKRVVTALEKELLRLKREVRAHVKADDDLLRDSKLLQSVPAGALWAEARLPRGTFWPRCPMYRSSIPRRAWQLTPD